MQEVRNEEEEEEEEMGTTMKGQRAQSSTVTNVLKENWWRERERERRKENKAERWAAVDVVNTGWQGDLSPRQPLTTHVALLGASTGRESADCGEEHREGGREGSLSVWTGERKHRAEEVRECAHWEK